MKRKKRDQRYTHYRVRVNTKHFWKVERYSCYLVEINVDEKSMFLEWVIIDIT